MNIDGVNIINMYRIYHYINIQVLCVLCSNQVEIKLYMSVRSNTNIENGMPK